jgi:hypothetical protein
MRRCRDGVVLSRFFEGAPTINPPALPEDIYLDYLGIADYLPGTVKTGIWL